MTDKWRSEGLLMGTRPLSLAELVCRRLIGSVRVVDEALLLDANTACTGATNAGLIKEEGTVSELRRADKLSSYGQSSLRRRKRTFSWIHWQLIVVWSI